MTQPSKNAEFMCFRWLGEPQISHLSCQKLGFRWLRSPFGKALSHRNLGFDVFEEKMKSNVFQTLLHT